MVLIEVTDGSPFLDEVCCVCGNKYKVGDKLVMAVIDKSETKDGITTLKVPVHKDCSTVEE